MMEIEDKYLKSFANVQARNIRYLFIIDSKSKVEDILDLFYANQRFWGGKYNPIIPSVDGVISDSYLKLASSFDPDYVIHSNDVDLEKLKPYFNPIKYEKLAYFTVNLEGVDSNYLLHTGGYNTVLFSTYLYRSMPTLYSFYKLNFDFSEWGSDDEIFSPFETLIIESNNQHELNHILAYSGVFFSSLLSRKNVHRPILKTPVDTSARIELIVSDDKNQFQDLMYYWNRQLYLEHGSYFLNQIYITASQLEEFLSNNKTVQFFATLNGARDIEITSYSLPKEELDKIVQRLNTWQQNIDFSVKTFTNFPFEITGKYNTNKNYDEPLVRQSLMGKKDLLHLPTLSFAKHKIFGNWMLDIEVERDHSDVNNTILLPLNTEYGILFCKEKGRINKKHSISVLVSHEDRSIDFKIPTDEEILNSLLTTSSTKKSKIFEITTSSDGLRLSSLLKLFNKNYYSLDSFFHNKFWLGIFRSKSISAEKDDRIKKSKGIVSMLDLKQEYITMFEKEGYEFKKRYFTSHFNELLADVKDLVKIGAYFIGRKIKCNNCGSSLWYSLSELDNTMECKGCFNSIRPKVQAPDYYKLNDVVRNCLISNSGSANDIHGNLTVLHTLLSKQTHSKRSFYCIPSQDFFEFTSESAISDIDIICVSDGKLTIGEAKNSAKEFTNKVIDNLIYLGDNIEPSEVILAFKEGELSSLDDAVNKVKAGLKNKNITVTAYKTFESYYTSRNLSSAKSEKTREYGKDSKKNEEQNG